MSELNLVNMEPKNNNNDDRSSGDKNSRSTILREYESNQINDDLPEGMSLAKSNSEQNHCENHSSNSSKSSPASSNISITAEQQETTIEFSSLKDDEQEETRGSVSEIYLENNSKSGEDIKFDDIKSQFASSYKGPKGGDMMSQDCGDGHFTISWHKLDYVVESKWYKLASQRKLILSSLSGSFKSGQLSAILGPSGAGKSTLIDCLLGKRGRGLSGTTKVSFENKLLEQERREKRPLKIATIPQQDYLIDSLTVAETFMYASRIKNAHLDSNDEYETDESSSGDRSKIRKAFDHFANVQRVIKQLHLSSCASLRCAKLSGGQYKRVSIGQELLSRPDIMVLDEPTSGLDSVTCYQTIKALRDLIEDSPYPMAIIATIHQPDIEVFDLFHKAYVLASGGRAIYEGPTESIFDTIQMASKVVEMRHSLPLHKLYNNKSSEDWQKGEEDVKQVILNKQLEARSCNPARLIVELATNKYGNEITNCLSDIQSRDHLESEVSLMEQSVSDITASVFNSSNELSYKFANSKQESPVASTSTDSIDNQCRLQNMLFKTTDLSVINEPRFDYHAHDPVNRKADLDKLIYLASANFNRKRTIKTQFRHLVAHTSRSWKTILRDPMLFTVQVMLHIVVPLLISYSFQGHRSDACPRVGPLDVIEEAYRNGTAIDDLNSELRVVSENLGYIFFQIYVIIFAAVCVTSLTYPLVMHVLLKEYRNGWYSMNTYFIGRTLADLPVLVFNVVLAMAISYHLTGQPLSPFGWRFVSVAAITVLATLVAQTWGLIFGALLMNAPQSAVFVAPASTAPLVVVSGFLIRTKSLPFALQVSSKLSYFTYLLNGIIVSRYGFNRCPCAKEDFSIEPSHLVPQQARALIDIWVDTFSQDYSEPNSTISVDLIGKLVDSLSKAKTFGYSITSCSQVKPFTMLDYDLDDSDLVPCYVILIGMLIFFRWLAYMILVWKIRSSL